MNQEIKAKWVEALRSGEYKQGTGRLRTDDGRYCCLGVLTMLIDPSKISDGGIGIDTEFSGYLPKKVREAADIFDTQIEYNLAEMNDRQIQKNNFPEIADYIEANL